MNFRKELHVTMIALLAIGAVAGLLIAAGMILGS